MNSDNIVYENTEYQYTRLESSSIITLNEAIAALETKGWTKCHDGVREVGPMVTSDHLGSMYMVQIMQRKKDVV